VTDLEQQSTGAAEQGDPPPHDVVGIFPDRSALIRLVGAVLAERHDEWTEGRRYLGLDVLARSQAVTAPTDPTEEPTNAPAITTAA
jgi:putative transposase